MRPIAKSTDLPRTASERHRDWAKTDFLKRHAQAMLAVDRITEESAGEIRSLFRTIDSLLSTGGGYIGLGSAVVLRKHSELVRAINIGAAGGNELLRDLQEDVAIVQHLNIPRAELHAATARSYTSCLY